VALVEKISLNGKNHMPLSEISMTISIDLDNVPLYPKMRHKKIYKNMTAILVYSLENKRLKNSKQALWTAFYF